MVLVTKMMMSATGGDRSGRESDGLRADSDSNDGLSYYSGDAEDKLDDNQETDIEIESNGKNNREAEDPL